MAGKGWREQYATHSDAMAAWRVHRPPFPPGKGSSRRCGRTRRPIDQVNSVCALGSAGMTPPVRQSCRHMPPCAANRPPDAQTYR